MKYGSTANQCPNERASPTANWPAAADAGGWPVGGGLRLTENGGKRGQTTFFSMSAIL
jgi:hypothetical protein